MEFSCIWIARKFKDFHLFWKESDQLTEENSNNWIKLMAYGIKLPPL